MKTEAPENEVSYFSHGLREAVLSSKAIQHGIEDVEIP